VEGYIYIINVYAPSGTGKKRERDEFFMQDLPYILQQESCDYIIGGDFNCILHQADCTGTPNISKPLENLIIKCKLRDDWDNKINAHGYTYYTAHGATRIDRIYMSMALHTRKICTTTLIAAFTDHNAVQVKIEENQTPILRGPRKWKLNTTLLRNDETYDNFQTQWEEWRTKQKWYRDVGHWWVACAKTRLRRFFINLGKETAREYKQQENFYHTCLYDLLRCQSNNQERNTKIKYYKTKLIQLKGRRLQQVQAELRGHTVIADEQVTLYHNISRHQRRQKRNIVEITDVEGRHQTTPQNIKRTFYTEIQKRFNTIQVKEDSLTYMCAAIRHKITDNDKEYIEGPITETELTAIKKKHPNENRQVKMA
jgi:hypothetical protein